MKKTLSLLLITLCLFSMSGCGAPKERSYNIAPSGEWQDGTYTITTKGFKSNFDVTTTISDGKLASVEVGDNKETASRGGRAIKTMPDEMIEEQTYDVDIVSGATRTSTALRTAVGEALEKASAKSGDE